MDKQEISKYFSDISKKRKNPYLGFKDKKKASEAGKLGGKARWSKLIKPTNTLASGSEPEITGRAKDA